MIHDDPIVYPQLKLHYFLHYFNLFLPIFLLPPLSRLAKHRLLMYGSVVVSGLFMSLIVCLSVKHIVPTDSFVFKKYLAIETEPMAVLYVFCAYIAALLAYHHRTKPFALIIGALLLVWFTFIIFAVQTERVVVLYCLALVYFLLTNFNKIVCLLISACFAIAACSYIISVHLT